MSETQATGRGARRTDRPPLGADSGRPDGEQRRSPSGMEALEADRGPNAELAALDAALQRVGDRWSLLIVEALLAGPRRYNELQELISGIATNVLATRLRHLEAERIILAVAYSRRPARFTYELTASGHRLAGPLRLLAEWGSESGGSASESHGLCGTPFQMRRYCPTCDLVVGPGSDEPVFV